MLIGLILPCAALLLGTNQLCRCLLEAAVDSGVSPLARLFVALQQIPSVLPGKLLHQLDFCY